MAKSQGNFSQNALFIMKKLYFKKDKNGNRIESKPAQLFERVAKFVSSAETDESKQKDLHDKIYELMLSQKFMFSSPTLFNAGTDFPLGSSCFVGKLGDDMGEIMKAATDTAITFKAGAGMGLNFGGLRPKGAPVGRGGTASGPVSFMRLFNEVGEAVKSGGVRRAAFMAMMDINHPDVEKFITSKDYVANLRRENPKIDIDDDMVDKLMSNVGTALSESIHDEGLLSAITYEVRKNLFEPLSNMNISVAVTDKFMESVKEDMDFELDRHKDFGVSTSVNARELFHKIAISAWSTADPGVWFIDRANYYDTVPQFGRIESTNPCGEQSLHHYTSCNLGSINLCKFVDNSEFDYDGFAEVVVIATRALDNVIDVAEFPTDDFKENTYAIRPIGLGYTGLAETMFKLGIAYDSDEGIEFAAGVSRVMTQSSIRASIELAVEKGSFPIFDENKSALINTVKHYFDDDAEKLEIESLINSKGIRNSNWTTLAPTGSISLILDAYTYSLEPQFALAYNKNLIDGETLIYVDPEFKKAVDDDEVLINKVVENGGSCHGISEIDPKIRQVFKVAHDLSYDKRLEMQGAIQKYISNSISSTINLPSDVSVEEIEDIYLKAWELELKGVTVYRDGSKSYQPMTTMKKDGESTSESALHTTKWVRPRVLQADIVKTRTGSGTLYTSIGRDENQLPIELFINISKHGSEVSVFSEALGRVISIALQGGVPVDQIGDSIIGIVGDKPTWDKGKLIKSIPDAIGRILKDYAKRLEAVEKPENSLFDKNSNDNNSDIDYKNPTKIPGAETCPKCSEKALVRTEDCMSCLSCGYSKCG